MEGGGSTLVGGASPMVRLSESGLLVSCFPDPGWYVSRMVMRCEIPTFWTPAAPLACCTFLALQKKEREDGKRDRGVCK